MSGKYQILVCIVVSLAVAYGLICGYIYANGLKEPAVTSIIWKIAAFSGLFAFISFGVCFVTYSIFRP